MLLRQVKNKIQSAEMKDFNGLIVVVNAIDDDTKNVIYDLLFKQKILLEKRKLNKQDALKALDLGYCVRIVNDAWCEGEQELKLWKDFKNRMVVYKDGIETDEYLPPEYLTPNVKYYLEGTIFEGEYIPF